MLPHGRPPTPTALKLAAGNPGKRPLNLDEPTPDALDDLTPPTRLSPAARQAWAELAPRLRAAGLLTTIDSLAMEMLAESAAEYWAARQRVDEVTARGEPLVRNSLTGAILYHPAYSLRKQSAERLLTLMREFGKTPAARTRVRLGKQGDLFGSGLGSFEEFLQRIA